MEEKRILLMANNDKSSLWRQTFFFLWASWLSQSMASLHHMRLPVVMTRVMILYSENPGSCPGLTVTNVHEDQDACRMMKTNCMEISKQTDILQAFARMRSQSWQIWQFFKATNSHYPNSNANNCCFIK